MAAVTVIVPVYRAEAYLRACVDSILGQTFSDLEVILVDDGSPDGSGAICDEYAACEPRVRVLHQKNSGQSAARNHALSIASGSWLCFVDSDDQIHPRMIELLYEAASCSGAAIASCRMLESPALPDSFFREPQGDFERLTMDEPTLVRLHDADRYPGWVACAKLIRRELVAAYPFQEGRVYEDNEAVCRWLISGGSLAQLPEQLYYYRTNPDSTTQSAFSGKKLDYLWALRSVIRFYHSLGFDKMVQRFLDRYADAAASACYGLRAAGAEARQIRQVAGELRTFLKEEKLHLRKEQFEALLDAAHPGLVRLYWPVSGALRTVKEEGLRGCIRKGKNLLHRGRSQ